MKKVEVIVIGGGLAGLTAAIHLAQNNISTILFEKNKYPHHKVCGEYISKEVVPYLQELGIPIQELSPINISRLLLSTANGNAIETTLPMGGIGFSRFTFDNLMYQEAVKSGVQVMEEEVNSIFFEDNRFTIETPRNFYSSIYVFGAFGKRSNLDKFLNRPFFKRSAPWIAVKSHFSNSNFPNDLVALHNFRGGYCGISRTESGAVNVCYLATYESFKTCKNPKTFQAQVLQKNSYLNDFFANSTPIFEQPLTIAQISFEQKASVEGHILLLGDSAGLIHPLCGNGMAMAIHSAKIASELLVESLKSPQIEREKIEKEYERLWKLNFRKRMQTGRYLQKVLLNRQLSDISQHMPSKIPFLLPQIIKRTHGNSII